MLIVPSRGRVLVPMSFRLFSMCSVCVTGKMFGRFAASVRLTLGAFPSSGSLSDGLWLCSVVSFVW